MATLGLKSRQYKMLIDGALVDASNGETMNVLNPATGELLALAPKGTTEDVLRAVEAADKAAPGWAAIPMSARSGLLLKLAQLIRDNLEELATLKLMNKAPPFGRP